jgi:hypothetical protein
MSPIARIALTITLIVAATISAAGSSSQTTRRESTYAVQAYKSMESHPSSPAPTQGDTVCVYFEDFSNGAGGWTPVNRTGQAETYWHAAYEPDILWGSDAMFCSTVDSSYGSSYPSCYRQWKGYGSDWLQRVRKSYTLPSAPITMSFVLTHNTEWTSDHLYAQVRTSPTDTFTVLAEYTGVGNIDPEILDLSAWANQTIEFEFMFQSDGSYDDSDNLHNSNGFPVGIDNIDITGQPFEDFTDLNGATMEGWTAVGAPATPGSYRLVETPQCFPGFPGCDTTSTGEPYDACNAWVAYDSVTGEFPYLVPDPEGLLSLQSIAIESPVIPLPTDGTGYYVEFDVYWDIPAGAHTVVNVEWSFDGIAWNNDATVRLGGQGWEHYSKDITAQVLDWFGCGKPTNFAVRIGTIEWPYWYAFRGQTPGRYFKNASVKVAGTATPGVACEPSCGAATGIGDHIPSRFELTQNYPNPFNPTTTIAFSLAEAGPVQLSVYDVSGRLVKTLLNRNMQAKRHTVDWNGTDSRGNPVASGVYFYRLNTGRFSSTRKMLILK